MNDMKETTELGRNLNLDSSPKRINLFKARLSRIDATYEKYSKYSYEARRYVKRRYYDWSGIEIPFISDSERPNQSLNNTGSSKSLTDPLPTIDGSIANWASFKDTFLSLIAENRNLSPIQLFHYLKGSLVGIASQTVSAIHRIISRRGRH